MASPTQGTCGHNNGSCPGSQAGVACDSLMEISTVSDPKPKKTVPSEKRSELDLAALYEKHFHQSSYNEEIDGRAVRNSAGFEPYQDRLIVK